MGEEVAQRGAGWQGDLEHVSSDLSSLRALEEEVDLRNEPLEQLAVAKRSELLALSDPLRGVLRDVNDEGVAAGDGVAHAVHRLLKPYAAKVVKVTKASPLLLLARRDATQPNLVRQRLANPPQRMQVAALHLDRREVARK